MSAADEAHIHELSDDDPSRQRRDEAQTALSDELVNLRAWMTGLFGARAVRSLGFVVVSSPRRSRPDRRITRPEKLPALDNTRPLG